MNRQITRRKLLASAAPLVSIPFVNVHPVHARSALRVAPFTADMTLPIGHPMCCGADVLASVVEAPLLLKGIVLEDRGKRYVVCVIDWCEVRNSGYDALRRKIAAAARTAESNVSVHTTHTHNAPQIDPSAQRLIDKQPRPFTYVDLKFVDTLAARAASAAGEAAGKLRPFDHVATGQGRVERFASNRRVRMPDGLMKARYAFTKDPAVRDAPEGLIDPFVRTVSLLDGDTPIVRLHYYASHPQTIYGQGHVSPEAPGLARARLEREEGIPHLYFDGCGGNITAGKYNDGSTRVEADLTLRLHAGMKAAIAASRSEPVSSAGWRTAPVRFVLRKEPSFAEARFRRELGDPTAPQQLRLRAAMALAWFERLHARPVVELSALQLGHVRIVHLAAEAFIEYQRYAQSLRPDDFVAVAAYGEGGPGYVCTDVAYSEGGYEPVDSLVGPPLESRLKAAIAALLA